MILSFEANCTNHVHQGARVTCCKRTGATPLIRFCAHCNASAGGYCADCRDMLCVTHAREHICPPTAVASGHRDGGEP